MNKILSSTLSIGLCTYLYAGTIDKTFIDNLSNGGSAKWHSVGTSSEVTDLSIFDNAYVVWKYRSGEWSIFSNIESAKKQITDRGYPVFNSIEANNAFWVLKDIPAANTFTNNSTGSVFTTAYLDSLSEGWHHISTDSEITDLSLFNNMLYIWYYDDNGVWQLYSNNHLGNVSTIAPNRAIWVRASNLILINTVDLSSSGREVTFQFNLSGSNSSEITYSVTSNESNATLYENTNATGTIILDYGDHNLTFTVKDASGKEGSKTIPFSLSLDGEITAPTQPEDPEIIFNENTYKIVTSPITGKVWLDRNLGASMVCTQSRDDFADDASYVTSQENCFGDYYQWGRLADGHEKANSGSVVQFDLMNVSGVTSNLESKITFADDNNESTITSTTLFHGFSNTSSPSLSLGNQISFMGCTNTSITRIGSASSVTFSGCTSSISPTVQNEIAFSGCNSVTAYQGDITLSECSNVSGAVKSVGISDSFDKFLAGTPDWTNEDSNGSLRETQWSQTDGSSVCPSGFRVPSSDELLMETLDDAIQDFDTNSDGNIKITDYDTAFKNFLKLPIAGGRDGFMYHNGAGGQYGYTWTNSSSKNNDQKGAYFYLGTYGASIPDYGSVRNSGYPVRCIKD